MYVAFFHFTRWKTRLKSPSFQIEILIQFLMRKRLLTTILFAIFFLTSCSNTEPEDSGETLEFMIDMAKITGSLDGMRWDFSTDGAKGPWCFGMADSYIQNVMGFNGSNGTDRMGKVSNAYFRACMDG